jgi:hypothetical protein
MKQNLKQLGLKESRLQNGSLFQILRFWTMGRKCNEFVFCMRGRKGLRSKLILLNYVQRCLLYLSQCIYFHVFMPIAYVTHAVSVGSMAFYVWFAPSAPYIKVWASVFVPKCHICYILLSMYKITPLLESFIICGVLNWIRSEWFSIRCFSFEFTDTLKFNIVACDLSTWEEIVIFRMWFVSWNVKSYIWSLENEKSAL